MRNRHHLPTGLLLLGMAAIAPAQAQCLSCSTQMLQSTLTSNVHRSTNQALNRDNHSRDARNGICYDANRHLTGCNGEAASAGNGPGQQAQRGDRIVNGVLAGAVAEFTIAGNLIDMFAAMIPANDLEMHRAMNAPTLRIDGMTVAGG